MRANRSEVGHSEKAVAWTFCEVCGKPSEVPICAGCGDRIRAEAVARKKREDKKKFRFGKRTKTESALGDLYQSFD